MKNSFNKVLSLVLALLMIVSCFSVITVSAADECKHDPATDKVIKEVKATCSKSGYTTYECAVCGSYIVYSPKSETHTALVEVTGIAATCTTSARGAGVYCKDCTANADGTPNWALVAAAVAAGDKVLVEAKALEGDENKALGHDFVYFESFSDDCEVDSYSYYKCSRCEKTPAEVLADTTDTTDKTAIEAGEFPRTEVRAKGDHKFTKAEIVVKGDTCTDAVTKLTCKDCGATKTVTTPAKHDLVTLVKGTCGTYKAGKECKICHKQFGAVLNDNKTHQNASKQTTLKNNSVADKLIAAGYTTDASLKKGASCTTKGMEVWYCADCGAIYEKEVAELGHIKSYWSGEMKFGNDEKKLYCSPEKAFVTYCTRSGCCTFNPDTKLDGTYLEKEVIREAVAHVFVDKADDINKVDCGTQLSAWKECELCGYKKDIVATGVKAHAWGAWTDDSADYDCTTDWYHSRTCTNKNGDTPCTGAETHKKYKDKIAGAHTKGHTNSLLVAGVIPATCVSNSASALICTVCDKAPADYIVYNTDNDKNPENHVKVELTRTTGTTITGGTILDVISYPTCTEAGSAHIVCSCGATVEAPIKADGHIYKENVVVVKNATTGAIDFMCDNANKFAWTSASDTTLKSGWAKWDAAKQVWISCKSSDAKGTWIDVMSKKVSCKGDGYEAGEVCTRCGDVKTERVLVPQTAAILADKTNHNKNATTIGTPVAATCSADGYTLIYCPDCCKTTNDRVKVAYTTVKTDKDENDNGIDDGIDEYHTTNGKAVDAKAPSCKEAGNFAYMTCETCKEIWNIDTCDENCVGYNASTSTLWSDNCQILEHQMAHESNNPERAKLRHNFKNDVAAKDPTCTEAGWTAYKTCTICGAKSETYKALKATGHTMVTFEEVEVTCTTDGLVKINDLSADGKYCSVCKTNGTTNAVCVEVVTAYHNIVVVDGDGNDINDADENGIADCYTGDHTSDINGESAKDCTALEVTNALECVHCNDVIITGVSYKNEDHNWSNIENKFTVAEADGTGTDRVPFKAGQILLNGNLYVDAKGKSYYACEASFENYYECLRGGCEKVKKNGTKTEQPAHYYVDPDTKEDTVIELDCTKIEAHIGQECKLCGREVIDELPTGADKNAYLVMKHTNIKKDEKKATCTEAGHSVTVCLDCGEELVAATETPALGHHEIVSPINNDVTTLTAKSGKVWTISKKVKATKTAAGVASFYCDVCKTTVDVAIPALAGMDIEFAVVSESSELIRVDILASASEIKFNKITLTVGGHDGVVLADKRATLNAAAFNAADNVTLKQEKITEAVVTLEILVPQNIKGEDVNTTFVGDKAVVASVYFKVLYTAKATAGIMAYTPADISNVAEGTTLAAATNEFSTIEGADYYANLKALLEFKPVVIGDINGNGEIDATDVAQTAANAYTGTYVAALDFNKDGVVDIRDYVAVAVFSDSECTYADYLALIGIDYLEIVNAVDADLMKDLNGDGEIDEADRTYLAKQVLKELKAVSAYDKDLMRTVEDIIADVLA